MLAGGDGIFTAAVRLGNRDDNVTGSGIGRPADAVFLRLVGVAGADGDAVLLGPCTQAAVAVVMRRILDIRQEFLNVPVAGEDLGAVGDFGGIDVVIGERHRRGENALLVAVHIELELVLMLAGTKDDVLGSAVVRNQLHRGCGDFLLSTRCRPWCGT